MGLAVEETASTRRMESSVEDREMTSLEDARYRLRLAQEHLEDAVFEFQHARWSKAALSAQLSVENSAKSVIALTSYGDEVALKTPKGIYDEHKAGKALGIARQAVDHARSFIENRETLTPKT